MLFGNDVIDFVEKEGNVDRDEAKFAAIPCSFFNKTPDGGRNMGLAHPEVGKA